MRTVILTAKNEQGEHPNQAVPMLKCQMLLDNTTQQLAVIFEVHNSPIDYFYPNFHTYNALTLTRIMQADFLWETNCYELFLAFLDNENSPYVEINFSPTGYFNLYHFDGYRMPSQMPPCRLAITPSEREKLINFYHVSHGTQPVFWQTSNPIQQAVKAEIEKEIGLTEDSHRLVMMVDLAILMEKLDVTLLDKLWLNPCAVFLNEQDEADTVYFAHQHAKPPDFHDKNYWLKVEGTAR